jgi:DNA ligase D-like protein (predicted ligase)
MAAPKPRKAAPARSVPPSRPAKASHPLPETIEPMLARIGRPFDDPRFLFEVKWDGTRAMSFIERGRPLRMLNRRRRDIAWRYPELSFLANLPSGTVLDGEVVCLDATGNPSFEALQSREQVHSERRAAHSVAACPATYVVFDLLYDKGRSIMHLPCSERRERLRALVAGARNVRLVMSEGVEAGGVRYFEQAVAQGLEGVVAKRLDSPYEPGRRSGAWLKIKRHETVACVVIGFVPEGTDDFGSLIIAAQSAEEDGELRWVGRVGSGFDARLRARINKYLYSHLAERPVIACREKGLWVEPGLYCTVKCMERTSDGHLRAPVFGEVTHVRDEK